MTVDNVLEYRIHKALHGHFDVFDQHVDDVVQADVHALDLGSLLGAEVCLDSEAEDDRARGRGQHDVRLANVAGAGADYVHAHLIDAQLLDGAADRLNATVGIGLDHYVQVFDEPELPDVPIKFSLEGDNGFRTIVGLRIKLLLLSINYDYNIGEYAAHNIGFGLTFR